MKNIYDPVLTVTFRIFGEQDMGLSNEHRDGRFTVFTTGLLGARHTTLKRLCSFREQFFGHRGGKITKGEENLNQLPVISGGIYGVSGISMDIPEISMFHKQVTLCHQSGDIL